MLNWHTQTSDEYAGGSDAVGMLPETYGASRLPLVEVCFRMCQESLPSHDVAMAAAKERVLTRRAKAEAARVARAARQAARAAREARAAQRVAARLARLKESEERAARGESVDAAEEEDEEEEEEAEAEEAEEDDSDTEDEFIYDSHARRCLIEHLREQPLTVWHPSSELGLIFPDIAKKGDLMGSVFGSPMFDDMLSSLDAVDCLDKSVARAQMLVNGGGSAADLVAAAASSTEVKTFVPSPYLLVPGPCTKRTIRALRRGEDGDGLEKVKESLTVIKEKEAENWVQCEVSVLFLFSPRLGWQYFAFIHTCNIWRVRLTGLPLCMLSFFSTPRTLTA